MRPLALYLHSPFCVHKCGYCDFNSWGVDPAQARPQMELWLGALEKQMRYWRDRWGGKAPVQTIFWGGGTPSLLPNELLRKSGALLREYFAFAPDLEFTIECNPETLDRDKLDALRDAGATRLSMGVQSFDDLYLERLERHARRADNLRALELVATHWLGPWSLDLMFALPGQSLEHWLGEMDTALSFAPKHLSAYQLTLTTERAKNWQQAPEEELLFFFNLAEERMAEAGLPKYEVSNFAWPGQECRHNLAYWRLEPFLGLGPGAAGLLPGSLLGDTFSRFGAHQRQAENFDVWAAQAGSALYENSTLTARSAKDHLFELLMMGLRLREGVLEARLGTPDSLLFRPLEDVQALGFIERVSGLKGQNHWRCTPRGAPLLDGLLAKLFAPLEEVLVRGLDPAYIDPTFK